jgi:hypothetical protein
LKQQCQKLWADMFGDSEQIATLYMSWFVILHHAARVGVQSGGLG